MDSIDALRAEADEFLNAEGEVLNAEVDEHRGSVAVAEEERSEIGPEVSQRGDGRVKWAENPVSVGLPERTEGELVTAGEGQGHSVPDASVQPDPSGEELKSAKSITFVNGAKFSLGEMLPWKGIHFQVIYVGDGTVALQGVGLSNTEIKRIMKRRPNA